MDQIEVEKFHKMKNDLQAARNMNKELMQRNSQLEAQVNFFRHELNIQANTIMTARENAGKMMITIVDQLKYKIAHQFNVCLDGQDLARLLALVETFRPLTIQPAPSENASR
jgi:hypothetical protein